MLDRGLGELAEWYDIDHPGWEKQESKYYDKNLKLFGAQ
jgi:hypothetical protein